MAVRRWCLVNLILLLDTNTQENHAAMALATYFRRVRGRCGICCNGSRLHMVMMVMVTVLVMLVFLLLLV